MSVYFVCSYTQTYFLVQSFLMHLSSGLFFFSLSKHCVKLKSLSLQFLTKHATLQKLHSRTSPGLLIALWTQPICGLTRKSVSNIWNKLSHFPFSKSLMHHVCMFFFTGV